MFSRWQGGFAALLVTIGTGVLVVLDTTDGAMRRWWSSHALTTNVVAGLLVLAITLLVVDQVVRLRQTNDKAQALAAQAGIMTGQASRAIQAVSQAISGSGDRDNALDETRTYMMMLLVGAPVLIEDPVSRAFLEQAQGLGGEMARALLATANSAGGDAYQTSRLDQAVNQLKAASTPLLAALDPETRKLIRDADSGLAVPSALDRHADGHTSIKAPL